MKIKTQFYWFIAGVFIIPFLVLFAFSIMEYYRTPQNYLVPGYDEVNEIAQTSVSQDDWENLRRFLSHKPEQLEFLVLDEQETLIFSSIESFVAGTRLSSDDLLNYITKTGKQYFYQFDYLNKSGDESDDGLILLTRLPKNMSKKPNHVVAIFKVFLLIMILVLTFCTIVVTKIVRSITSSVVVLEDATRRIAGGELDLEIDVRGNNEILSLTDSLNKMRLALLDDQNRRSRFIMGVSHDLRTPLSLIKGYTEVISDGLADDPEVLEKSLEIIDQKINQLDEMIDDLINYVKLDTGDWRKHLKPQNLYVLLSNFGKRIVSDGTLLHKNVTCFIKIPENTVVSYEEKLILRALENLTGNALRYTAENGSVNLEVSGSKEKGIQIKVVDNGCGIQKDDLPFVFDPFYRGSNSRREEGNGLGLSIVKNVIDSHGWKISISSEVNVGTEITITIPAEVC